MSAASGATHNLLELDRKRTTSEVLTGSVINPGGPGGSGVDAVLNAGPELFTGPGAEVRARFDIVGFDPRGIARSTALRCFGNSRQWGGYFTPFAFPSTPQEEQVWIGADLFLDGNCAQRGGSIADHMSTANVARDLDVLRRAVDDDGLTYYGVSYGSYLGVTYANLFPNRVRALVVDGVLDPIEWATGVGNEGSTIPFSTRLKSDVGACLRAERCCTLRRPRLAAQESSGSGHTPGRVGAQSQLLSLDRDHARRHVRLPVVGGLRADARCHRQPGRSGGPWRSGAALPRRAGIHHEARFPAVSELPRGFPAVACSDSDNPHSYAAWSSAGAAADAAHGYFGRIWTWASSICAAWPNADADRYIGPFNHATANPVLVIGNRFDPATRYEGAVTVSQLLPNSRLLTLAGWGHTSLFLSQCVDQAIARYLVDVTLPQPGAVCAQDHVPFTTP
jgi:pimeloyl-ACP methyl ester carboxylesterase